MSIQIKCACGHQFAVNDKLAGRSVACPACHCRSDAPEIHDEGSQSLNGPKVIMRGLAAGGGVLVIMVLIWFQMRAWQPAAIVVNPQAQPAGAQTPQALNGHTGHDANAALNADAKLPVPAQLDQTAQPRGIAPRPESSDGTRQADLGQNGSSKDIPPAAIAPFNAEQAKQHQEAWAKYLGFPVEYTNSIGMKFRLIPPGEFMMGSTPEEIEEQIRIKPGDRYIRSEAPKHKVVLTHPVYLGVHEVRQKDYLAVMGKNPSTLFKGPGEKVIVSETEHSTHPVNVVSWNEAAEFCTKLSQREQLKPFYNRVGETVTQLDGTGYRLPTEAEWEFSCRAGTITRYCGGETNADLMPMGWFGAMAGSHHAVGELKANPFGIYDLHGNISEWVQDWWEPIYFEHFRGTPAINPVGPATGETLRVVRGGNWVGSAVDCRSSGRSAAHGPHRYVIIGFRAALAIQVVKGALANPAPQPTEIPIANQADEIWKGWPKDTPPPAIAPFNVEQAKRHQEAWAKHLGVPVEFTNSIGMKFRLIPPGEFFRGSTLDEIGVVLKAFRNPWSQKFAPSEAPRHKVILTRPFYLGVHEVTQGKYATIMGINPSEHANGAIVHDSVAGRDTTDYPVERASWNDAAEFCAKLSQQEKLQPSYVRAGESVTPLKGTGYRFPTEAEWEFACRAGTTTKFWIGDADEELVKTARFYRNLDSRTHAVGELSANPFGIYDTHGNVWEWVQDGWEPTNFASFLKQPAIDPIHSPSGIPDRIIRGGSFFEGYNECRSASRYALVATTRGYGNVGFRAALSIDAVKALLAAGAGPSKPPLPETKVIDTTKSLPTTDKPALAPTSLNGGQQTMALSGHTLPVKVAVYSPDGKRLASASWDRTVKVWDATSGQEKLTLRGHTDWVQCVAFSPDGKRLASASYDLSVKVWDAASGQETLTLKGHVLGVTSVTFSPDGKWLVTGSVDGTVKIWDATNGQEIRTLKGHTAGVTSVAFSPDGKRLASGSGDFTIGEVKIWDASSGQETLSLKNHIYTVTSVAFSPDGKRLATTSIDQTAKIWDLTNGQELFTLRGFNTWVRSIAFSPDGKRLATASHQNTLKVWDALSGREIITLKGHTNLALSVAFSPDGNRLASASVDRMVMVWDVSPTAMALYIAQPTVGAPRPAVPTKPREFVVTQKTQPLPMVNLDENPITLRGHSQSIHWVTFTSDGKRLVSASRDGTAKVWDALTGQTLLTLDADYSGGTLSPDRTRLALGGNNEVTLLDLSNGKAVLSLKNDGKGSRGFKSFSDVVFSPDGKRLAADHDGELTVWDISSGQQTAAWKAHPNSVAGLTFSPDGKQLASSGEYDQMVKLWDAATGKETWALKAHPNGTTRVTFSPDGKHLVSSSAYDQVVKSLDSATGKEALTLKAHSGGTSQVIFSPDGKRLVTAGSGTDSSVKIWDAATGQEILALKGTGISSWCIAFDPDWKRLVTSNYEGQISLWDATSGQQTLVLEGHTSRVTHVAFSNDGKRLVSASDDLTLKLWDLTPRPAVVVKPGDPAAPLKKKTPPIPLQSPGHEVLALEGHMGTVESVVFTTDGKRLVSASEDKTLKVWDAKTGVELLTLTGHTGAVTSVAATSDGKLLASAGKDQLIKVWDAVSGKELHSIKAGGSDLKDVVFSPDGKRLAAVVVAGTLKIWDTANGQELLTLKGRVGNVKRVAFSPDGLQLALASGEFQTSEVKLWDVTKDREILALKGHTRDVTRMAYSPDGKWLASASDDHTIKIWDLKTNQEILTLIGFPEPVHKLSISLDGKQLASVSRYGQARLWDTATWQEILMIKGSLYGHVTDVAFSPDGKWLATATNDRTVKVWDLSRRPVAPQKPTLAVRTPSVREMPSEPRPIPVPGVAPAPVVDQAKLTLKGHASTVNQVAVSPDGKRLASAGYEGIVKVWEAATGQEVFTLKGHTGVVTSVEYSPDGKLLATGSQDKSIKLWDATTGQETPVLMGHTDMVWGVTFSPDGKRLVSTSNDQTVKVWEIEGSQELLTLKGNTKGIYGAVFSPDGKQLATAGQSFKRTVQMWDATTGHETVKLMGHRNGVHCVAFSPDGKRLASASGDGTIVIWDAVTGHAVFTIRGYGGQSFHGPLHGVAFSLDGKELAGVGGNNTVVVWDATTGIQTLSLTGHTDRIMSVAFTPDGKRLVSGSADKTVKIWDIGNLPRVPRRGFVGRPNSDGQSTPRPQPKPVTNDPKGDLKTLQGSWQVTDVTLNSATPAHPEMIKVFKSVRCTFNENLVSIVSDNMAAKLSVFLDSSQTLKTIDLLPTEGPQSGVSLPGIYSIDGDTLQFCVSPGMGAGLPAERPKDMKADQSLLLTFKRTKSNVEQADLKELQGTWRVSDVALDSPFPAPPEFIEVIKSGRCLIQDDDVTILSDIAAAKYTVVLDSSQTPKTVDLIPSGGFQMSMKLSAIYSIDKDTFQFCMLIGGPGGPGGTVGTRPKSMKPDKSMLLTLKRTATTEFEKLEWFDFQTWQQAAEKLRLMKVWTNLATRDQGRLYGEDRWFGLPVSVAAVGIIDLPDLSADGKIPDDVWSIVSSISHVVVISTSMTDAALLQLSGHRGLAALHVSGSWTGTTTGIAELKKCPKLFDITLYQVPEVQEVVKNLSQLTELRSLSINEVPMTTETLGSITQLSKLESLSLVNGEIDDDLAVQIAKLPNLKFLMLRQYKPTTKNKPKMTDKGLTALKGLKNLRSLDVQGHRMSPEAVADFQAALPKCRVSK